MLLKASRKTLEIVNFSLSKGLIVHVSKNITTDEVIPTDLVVSESDDPVEAAKNMAVNDIMNLMNQNIFGMCVLDCIDYLNCTMKLMSAGIFITDDNREDKYFEIIEAAQSIECPKELTEESTFEDEQNYIEQKRKYDAAQDNLSTLEKYLDAYGKISKVKFVGDFLNKAKEQVESSTTLEEVENATREYCEKLDKYIYGPPCTT